MCAHFEKPPYVHPLISSSYLDINIVTGDITHAKAKMFYQNFDDQVTRVHGVIVEGWPLSKFCSPGDVGSLTELQVLFNSWKSGSTCF